MAVHGSILKLDLAHQLCRMTIEVRLAKGFGEGISDHVASADVGDRNSAALLATLLARVVVC